MCTFGPILLGHAHPMVDEAAATTAARGDVLNGPGPEMVELAEVLVDQVEHADWAMFSKNGSDANNLAMVVARAHMGRRKVLMARGSYHGIGPWALPPESAGTTVEDHVNTVYFTYNDLDSVENAVAQAGEDDVAAIVCTPHRHDVYVDQEPVDPEFARGVREICDRLAAALVIDDVRSGSTCAAAGPRLASNRTSVRGANRWPTATRSRRCSAPSHTARRPGGSPRPARSGSRPHRWRQR
jgi:glutamate-1-semialdehyde 2,1-aminomutase